MTKSIGMIVVGEIGSTETRLALCGLDVGRPVVVVDETSPNSRFTGLTPMVQAFLRKYRPPQIRAAAFVVGGPIQGGVSLAESLPWAIGSQALASELSIDKVAILTVAEGVAHAIPGLAHEDFVAIGGGDSGENANQVVLSVGASTSVAGLFYYLRVVVALYADPAEDAVPALAVSRSMVLLLAVLATLLIWLGVYPTPLLNLIRALSQA